MRWRRFVVRGPHGPQGSADRWTVVDLDHDERIVLRARLRNTARDAATEFELANGDTEDEGEL